MGKIEHTQIGNLLIEGYAGDYVYETIEKSNYYYEGRLLEKWLPHMDADKIIFDIGANLGNHTLFWATHLSYEKIFSFEPFIPNYERLYNNITQNSLENVFPICKAIGSKKGYTTVSEFHEENYGGTTLNAEVSETIGEIKVTDVDSFCREERISHVDFIKIDTEGFELSVLDGMQSILENSHPDLWIEVSTKSFYDVMKRLSKLNYVLLDVEGFNLFFLNKRRHKNIESVKVETILAAAFYNLERVNIYYKNYITVKGWLASKNNMLVQAEQETEKQKNINASLNEAMNTTNEKYKMALNNYDTVKIWYDNKLKENEKLKSDLEEYRMLTQQAIEREQSIHASLNEALNTANKKYKKALNNYNTVKIWYENKLKENEELKSDLEESHSLLKKMKEYLSVCFQDYDFNISKMEQLSRMLTRLEIQNNTLAQKNSEQKAILDKIDHNFFGRLAIKLYHFYQRCFHK